MPYDNLNNEKPILRDYLAAERTHLANERTLLAYMRTAIFVLVSALTFLKLFEADPVIRIASLLLVPVSLIIGAFGIYRFRLTRKKLAAFSNLPQ